MFFSIELSGEAGDGKDGKTTTAFGVQEWLKRAVRGEIDTPIFVRSVGDVREKEFDVNYDSCAARMNDADRSVLISKE